MPAYDRALHALRAWLDSYSGIWHLIVGMALDNAPGRVILSRHLHVTEVRHGTAAVDLPQLFQGHLA